MASGSGASFHLPALLRLLIFPRILQGSLLPYFEDGLSPPLGGGVSRNGGLVAAILKLTERGGPR